MNHFSWYTVDGGTLHPHPQGQVSERENTSELYKSSSNAPKEGRFQDIASYSFEPDSVL